MARCFHCDKTTMFGRSHTHHRGVAGGRWKKRAPKTNRKFKANIQPITILQEGKKKRIKLCSKCIKRIKKDLRDGKKPFYKIAYLENKLTKSQSDKVNKDTKLISDKDTKLTSDKEAKSTELQSNKDTKLTKLQSGKVSKEDKKEIKKDKSAKSAKSKNLS